MSVVKLKHVDRFVDRFGRRRHYFRRGHGPRVKLPGEPGSDVFMLAYQAALAGQEVCNKVLHRGEAGTFERLTKDYFDSPDFVRLAGSSQRAYRGVIERLVADEKIGHRLVREMTRTHVQKIVARRANTPGAANDVLKKLKILMHFAIDNGWRRDDPTVRIKKFAAGEFHTWTDGEIEQFEVCWKLGTKERLAFALLLYTGQRASDVARMSSADVNEEGIWVMQQKTKAKLLIPVQPELQAALGAAEVTEGTILKTGFGGAFSSKSFSNFMADRIGEAGLPDRCVTHGLRKAAARRLAEAGCSANEIAAITGHASLEEVARYTKAAEQKKLARSAIGRLRVGKDEAGIPNLPEGFGKNDGMLKGFKAEIGEWRTRQDSNL
ncbi:MAG TPA: tyrosine-type recombinase/integrase [Hyphomicrobiaceae bacterium]